jgi:hypothetical protein
LKIEEKPLAAKAFSIATRPFAITVNLQAIAAVRRFSDLEDFALFFDLAQLKELAFAAAGAGFAGLLPGGGAAEIGIPKGPGFALPRSGGVDRALPFVGIEKDASAVGELLQAFADTDAADVELFELFEIVGHDDGSDRGDLFVVHPDIAGRASAAVATLRAFKLQACMIPRLLAHQSVSSAGESNRSFSKVYE